MTYGFIYDITIIIKIQKQRLTNMEKKFVIEDGVLTNYNGSASNVVIPDGVTSIERFAFSECKHIKKVTIPNRTHKRQYHSVADQRFDVIQNHVVLVNSLMARCLLSF